MHSKGKRFGFFETDQSQLKKPIFVVDPKMTQKYEVNMLNTRCFDLDNKPQPKSDTDDDTTDK
jgi:hypothetical protein